MAARDGGGRDWNALHTPQVVICSGGGWKRSLTDLRRSEQIESDSTCKVSTTRLSFLEPEGMRKTPVKERLSQAKRLLR